MLENLVFFELKRREYEVYTGKLGDKEIDFIAVRGAEKLYLQVARQLPENSAREIDNLLAIKDNYPKLILSADSMDKGIMDGIEIAQIAEWLVK